MKTAAVVLLAMVALVASACSGGTKAGGRTAKRTALLSMASQFPVGEPDQLALFAIEVARRSGGTIRIVFKNNWRAGDAHQELDTIRDVRAGKVDLAWVGARAWDWVGVHTFDPLVAPLLIDSYLLEQQVFARGLPERMLGGLARAGVVGIGVLPGPMRKVLGVHRPLLAPTAFAGRTFGVQGIVAAETLRALGASPRQQFAAETPAGLDGLESQMSNIFHNQFDTSAHYLGANLNLWPRPLVIFAAPKIFDSLSSTQQTVLRDAAAAAVPEAMAASRNEDAGAVRALCARRKLAFLNESSAQLAAFRRAVSPVYTRIERDESVRRAIVEISGLKRGLAPAPAIHCAHEATSSVAAVTPIDGSWEMRVTVGDLRHNHAYAAYGYPNPSPDALVADAGTYRMWLRRGRFRSFVEGQLGNSTDTGTYRLEGGHRLVEHITGGNSIGDTNVYRWSLYRDTLTLRKPLVGAKGPPNPTFAPWHRAGR